MAQFKKMDPTEIEQGNSMLYYVTVFWFNFGLEESDEKQTNVIKCDLQWSIGEQSSHNLRKSRYVHQLEFNEHVEIREAGEDNVVLNEDNGPGPPVAQRSITKGLIDKALSAGFL